MTQSQWPRLSSYLVEFSQGRNEVGPFWRVLKILQSLVHSRNVGTVLGVAVQLALLETDERHAGRSRGTRKITNYYGVISPRSHTHAQNWHLSTFTFFRSRCGPSLPSSGTIVIVAFGLNSAKQTVPVFHFRKRTLTLKNGGPLKLIFSYRQSRTPLQQTIPCLLNDCITRQPNRGTI